MSSVDYQIKITDCNSIESAHISLRRSSLNIKYGPNGIGKSTIARALTLRAEDIGQLAELTPFKYRAIENGPRPAVEGADGINSVLTFNDQYVSQFVFQPDEVLKDSFEIFINTDEYKQGLDEIESIFESLKDTFAHQAGFNEALAGFTELRDAFSLTKTGDLAKSSTGYKALGVSGKIQNIPGHFLGYRDFLHSNDPAGWISWQSKGKSYLRLSGRCPFCAAENIDKATAEQVSVEYQSAAVKKMTALRTVIDKLEKYFEPGCLEILRGMTRSITAITPEQRTFLASLRMQIETFLSKLTILRALSFHALRDEDNIAIKLQELQIDLSLLAALNAEATKAVVDSINDKLEEVGQQINEIRRRIGVQKTTVGRLIRQHQDTINEFLSSAGYRYKVRMEANEDSYRMLLEHHDLPGHLESAASHLSYGEKNAFALVLFMHHARKQEPDLVVLDDPISSFDKTKKFAILHQLFHGSNSLRNLTTLLLTHDIEPAIDIVLTGTSDQFRAANPAVHFLSGRSGVVREKPIEATDITTFTQVCDANIESATDIIIKCVYLRRRFEINGPLGLEYNLLSSLLHLRENPTKKSPTGAQILLDKTEIREATNEVRQFIPNFDYERLLSDLLDVAVLSNKYHATDVGYEKVQLFRILSKLRREAKKSDEVFTKFVNETYHIENEYVMQLNPKDFDAVPEHVIAACSERVKEAVKEVR